MKKPSWACALILMYIVTLGGVYVLHVHAFPVDVILYSALVDAAIAACLCALVLMWWRRRMGLSNLEAGLLVLVWMLGGYAFAITVPTVLDRSLSFYILEKLQQRGGRIREDKMADIFVHEYIPEFRLMDVRMTEQRRSGTIVIHEGCVILTPWGARLARLSTLFRTHLLAKQRRLGGTYSDALTTPYAHSPQGAQGYEC